jgi:hypothetical protein
MFILLLQSKIDCSDDIRCYKDLSEDELELIKDDICSEETFRYKCKNLQTIKVWISHE